MQFKSKRKAARHWFARPRAVAFARVLIRRARPDELDGSLYSKNVSLHDIVRDKLQYERRANRLVRVHTVLHTLAREFMATAGTRRRPTRTFQGRTGVHCNGGIATLAHDNCTWFARSFLRVLRWERANVGGTRYVRRVLFYLHGASHGAAARSENE